jgi:hypothetical protein
VVLLHAERRPRQPRAAQGRRARGRHDHRRAPSCSAHAHTEPQCSTHQRAVRAGVSRSSWHRGLSRRACACGWRSKRPLGACVGADQPRRAGPGARAGGRARGPGAPLAKQVVTGRSREELLQLAGLVMRQKAAEDGVESVDEPEGMPQTPDELWHYVVKRYGVRIARVSVCSDHDTPFDYICAGFFGWYPNVFGIGPRGGGKVYDQALLHDLNAHWKPGCESPPSAPSRAGQARLRRLQDLRRPRRDPRQVADVRDQLQAGGRHALRLQGRGARRHRGGRELAAPPVPALGRGRDHAGRHLEGEQQPRRRQGHARRAPDPRSEHGHLDHEVDGRPRLADLAEVPARARGGGRALRRATASSSTT